MGPAVLEGVLALLARGEYEAAARKFEAAAAEMKEERARRAYLVMAERAREKVRAHRA